MSFYYRGEVPASKSILNRLLILQSFNPQLKILGDSRCDDVQGMRAALAMLLQSPRQSVNCGAAGTIFRFLALRASRLPGIHWLSGTPELLARPQNELIRVLQALGVQATLRAEGLCIESTGWKARQAPLLIDRSQSSQFASAVLLNAWGLDFDLDLQTTGGNLSEGYLDMTKSLVRQAGMSLETQDSTRLRILRHSEVAHQTLRAESDLSSAFAVAALAAVAGQAEFLNFPAASLQPDGVFVEILRHLGCEIPRDSDVLHVARAATLRPIEWDLGNCPDLFPVLSVLCALAEGRSRLYGAPQLAFKESNRIAQSATLLRPLGIEFTIQPDGLEIRGRGRIARAGFDFDPCHDHRLAMAAAVVCQSGTAVRVLHPEVVNKSFPEFWDIAR